MSSFTAFRAAKKAAFNAALLCPDRSEKESCRACAGTGSMTVSVTTYGTAAAPEHSTPTIGCVYCKSSGEMSKFDRIFQSLVHCKCKHHHTAAAFLAADGQRVFRNTTYLCAHCGFVRQFG